MKKQSMLKGKAHKWKRVFAFGGITLSIVAIMPMSALAVVKPVIDGDTWTFTVDGGMETYTSTISGSAKVVKEGAGVLDLGTGINTFTGGIEVNGGTLQGSLTALGGKVNVAADARVAPHKLVRIANGATLSIRDTTCDGNYQAALAEELEVAGHGVGNAGAVQRPSGSGSMHWLFDNVTLKADTTLSALSRWGLSAGTLDMGGHDLKIIGSSNLFEMTETITVQNPGEIEVTTGQMVIRSLIGEWRNFTLDDNTQLWLWGDETPLMWPIDIPASATVYVGNGTARNRNILAGDIAFGTKLTMNLNAAGRIATLSGGLNGGGELARIGAGTLYVTGKVDRTIGALNLTNGKVVLENAGKFSVTNRTSGELGFVPNTAAGTVAGTWTSIPRLIVTGDTFFTMPVSEDGTAATAKKHHLMIGRAANTFGVLDIQAGATVSNDLNVGRVEGSAGAVYLTGGKLYWRGGRDNQGWIGHEGSGYMSIGDEGEFVSDGFITIGKGKANGTGGIGIVHQRGGSSHMTMGNTISLKLARLDNSYGLWYQTGGSFTGAGHAAFCFADSIMNHDNVEAVLTLSGADTTMTFADDKCLYAYVSSNVVTSVVNLNDGATLAVRRIYKNVGSGNQATLFSDASFRSAVANSKLYVNFNGGILKPTQYGTFFNYGSYESNRNDDPDRIIVYSGGAVIDTELCTGGTTSWSAAVRKPSGNVLLSVSLPDDSVWVNNYIAPPRVVISGVNAHGATAVAEFDETAQRITGITVTSPGNDVPNDIAITIKSGDQKDTFDCPFTIGAPAKDGGLTKRGAHLLDFNMLAATPNTYEGPTVVEEGELKFSNRTYPEASPLVLRGGTVNFNGQAYTLKSIEGYGTIAGSGTLTVTNELRISCEDLFGANRSIAAQKVILADGVKLVITDPESLVKYKGAEQMPFLVASDSLSGSAPELMLPSECGDWVCVKRGNVLKFGAPKGMILSFR